MSMPNADDIERQLATFALDRIEAVTYEALLGYVRVAPAEPATLTMERIWAAYDALWDIPDETHFYVCHPDNATLVRATVGADAPGKHTCPIVKVNRACWPGKVLEIAWGEWPWWRKKGQGRRHERG